MIVQRVFHRVKRGHLTEYMKLADGRQESILAQVTKRTYTAHVGTPSHTVCHEAEFEDLAEMDAVWGAWWADPETPAYMERFWSLVEDSWSEVWDLVA